MRERRHRDPQPDAASWPLGRLLSTAARMVEHDWNDWLAQHHLTHAGLLALHALAAGPMTQRQLAADSHVEEQTMSRVVRRLERTGHITCHRDPADHRRLIIERTPTGAHTADQVLQANVAERLVADNIGDQAQFRDELIRLIHAIQASHGPDPRRDT